MSLIKGLDRSQVHFFPDCLEDYVQPNNPVRVLDAFVDSLDLAALGFAFPKEDGQQRGRPGYSPAVLLKLFLYGYLARIRSSRALERECARNTEVMWLTGKLAPDFKTIADFRKDNACAFPAVVRQFTALCRKLQLFGGELLAIDGVKIKAQNSPAKNFSADKLGRMLAAAEARLAEYLRALEENDASPAPAAQSAERLQEKIQWVREHKGRLAEELAAVEQSGQSQVSRTDPDSRSMKSAGRHVVGYNVQGAADAKHHLLVVAEVTNAINDLGQLEPVARAAKAALEVQKADVVADGGYVHRQDIKACQDMGLEAHLPENKMSSNERAGQYSKQDFTYDASQDICRCPAGAQLQRIRNGRQRGLRVYQYAAPAACAKCALKRRCTNSSYRIVTRWEHEDRLERMREAVRQNPQKLARRKTVIEHCWGTLKWLLAGGFLLRTKIKAQAELSLAHLAYNFKRAVNVLGATALLRALA